MWNKTQIVSLAEKGMPRPDSGLTNFLADPHSIEQPPARYLTQVTKNMIFNFVGPVSRECKVGSLPVCEVFNHTFYVHGCGHDTLDYDVALPAWLILSEDDYIAQYKKHNAGADADAQVPAACVVMKHGVKDVPGLLTPRFVRLVRLWAVGVEIGIIQAVIGLIDLNLNCSQAHT